MCQRLSDDHECVRTPIRRDVGPGSRPCVKGQTPKIDAKMHERILRRPDRLDAAAMPQEMNIRGFDFHALRGFKPTRCSVHVNGPWCITFEFEDGDACRVTSNNITKERQSWSMALSAIQLPDPSWRFAERGRDPGDREDQSRDCAASRHFTAASLRRFARAQAGFSGGCGSTWQVV